MRKTVVLFAMVSLSFGIDTEAPTISCPTNVTSNNYIEELIGIIKVRTDAGKSTATVTWDAPVVTDDSGQVNVTSSPYESGHAIPVSSSIYMITFTATDSSGNKNTCEFALSVLDREDPICTVNPVTLSLDKGDKNVTIDFAITVMDNVEVSRIDTIQYEDVSIEGSGQLYIVDSPLEIIGSIGTFPLGETVVLFRVVDSASPSGNVGLCRFRVMVNDVPYHCGINEFTCTTTHCVKKSRVCDNIDDCFDGSDEIGCSTTPSPSSVYETTPVRYYPNDITTDNGCYSGEFECDNGQCIEAFRVCNFGDDCYDGSDERNCNERANPTGNTIDLYTTVISDPCHNACGDNGVCITDFLAKFTEYGFRCDCNTGHSGKYCENDLCGPLNCLNNGKCEVSWLNKASCDCPKGYRGKRCEEDLCGPLNCLNNGECEVGWFNTASCDCPKGYSGDRCETDLCGPLNCLNNGKCEVSWLNKASCDCPKGYRGKRCEEDLCDELHCLNRGKCEISWWSSKPSCDCPDGYTGERCEHDCRKSYRLGCRLLPRYHT